MWAWFSGALGFGVSSPRKRASSEAAVSTTLQSGLFLEIGHASK